MNDRWKVNLDDSSLLRAVNETIQKHLHQRWVDNPTVITWVNNDGQLCASANVKPRPSTVDDALRGRYCDWGDKEVFVTRPHGYTGRFAPSYSWDDLMVLLRQAGKTFSWEHATGSLGVQEGNTAYFKMFDDPQQAALWLYEQEVI